MSGGPTVLERRDDAHVDGRIRLIAAAVVAPASLVLLTDAPDVYRVVVGSLGLLVSLGWLAAYRRASRVAPVRSVLTLDDAALTVESPGATRTLAWAELDAIDLDEDAATLVLWPREGAPLRLEPGYGGLGTVELHATIERHRHGAKRRDRGYDGGHGG